MTAPMNFGDSRLPERVWSKISPCPMTGCWIWTGCYAQQLQIRWKVDGLWKVLSVRKLLASTLGITADGIGSDCHACCNPLHFRYGTAAELAKQWNEAHQRTFCENGHEYSVEGYYAYKNGNHTVRRCRACHYAANQRYITRRWRRRLARMKPARRALYWTRRARLRELWLTGKVRRPDGSSPPMSMAGES